MAYSNGLFFSGKLHAGRPQEVEHAQLNDSSINLKDTPQVLDRLLPLILQISQVQITDKKGPCLPAISCSTIESRLPGYCASSNDLWSTGLAGHSRMNCAGSMVLHSLFMIQSNLPLSV